MREAHWRRRLLLRASAVLHLLALGAAIQSFGSIFISLSILS